jgi:hypothetical protein
MQLPRNLCLTWALPPFDRASFPIGKSLPWDMSRSVRSARIARTHASGAGLRTRYFISHFKAWSHTLLLAGLALSALELEAASIVTVDTNNVLHLNGRKVFTIGFSPCPPTRSPSGSTRPLRNSGQCPNPRMGSSPPAPAPMDSSLTGLTCARTQPRVCQPQCNGTNCASEPPGTW